jgi:Leucine-rich repeat (LRR) protein
LHQLSSLQHLAAGHNQLSGLGQLPEGLRSLGLCFNQLQALPAGWLSRCSALMHLDLAGTGITDAGLEQAVHAAALTQLRNVCISHNHLTRLPSWLPAGLGVLSASHNQIQEVPAGLCERLAGSLQLLFLQGNRLLQLPSELKLLSQLQLLALAGNLGLSPDAVHQGDGLAWAGLWLTAQKAATAATALRSMPR